MRALIRNNEVMTEPFSPWVKANLKWLTGTEKDADGNALPGDGWTLVEDYEPPTEGTEETEEIAKAEESVQQTAEDNETVQTVFDTTETKQTTESSSFDSDL